ncbi:hypothetical protein L3X38_040403 [Prunus dulcis]|uniref:Uncharacterized protein n=1 Tax=Prunus dulcis TaxID=3755 RepID=A0AAD4YTD1_PRUDU|nr:hypothetical protein L3X38_040403 [Prunus dulcis]
MRCVLEEGSLGRSRWWRRAVAAVVVEAEAAAERLRASSSSSLSSILSWILVGFRLSISAISTLWISSEGTRVYLLGLDSVGSTPDGLGPEDAKPLDLAG